MGPPPGFMETATMGARAIAKGMESASKSIADAIKEKDEEEKALNKLAKAGDTAMKAMDAYAKSTGQPVSVYGEMGEAGYLSKSAEERISLYEGAKEGQEMIGKMLSNRASKLQGDVYKDQMEEGDATAKAVRDALHLMSRPTPPMPPLPQGFGDAATPAQQAGALPPPPGTFMERRAAAAKQALDRNPGADIAGMSQALDRLLPEPDVKGTAIPGSVHEVEGMPNYMWGITSATGSGSFIPKPGADSAGDIEVKDINVPDSDKPFKVVTQGGEIDSGATATLHRGSAQDDPFKGLSSQNQSYAAGQARQYWKLMREKQLLEQDMRDHGRTAEDDVYATDGSIGRDPSYQEEFDEIDNRLTRIREALQSFRLRIDDFDQRGNYTHRPGGISFDAFQSDTR